MIGDIKEQRTIAYSKSFPLSKCATSMADMKGSLDKSALATELYS